MKKIKFYLVQRTEKITEAIVIAVEQDFSSEWGYQVNSCSGTVKPSHLLGRLKKVNNRGYTFVNYTITGRPVKLFYARGEFDTVELADMPAELKNLKP